MKTTYFDKQLAGSLKRSGYVRAQPQKYTKTLPWNAEWGLKVFNKDEDEWFVGARFLTEEDAQEFCDYFHKEIADAV